MCLLIAFLTLTIVLIMFREANPGSISLLTFVILFSPLTIVGTLYFFIHTIIAGHEFWIQFLQRFEESMKELKDESPDAHDILTDMLSDGGHDPELLNRHSAKISKDSK